MSQKANKKKTGRPPVVTKKLSGEELKKLMQFRPSVSDVAGFFDCSKRSVQKFIEDNYNMSYREFREIHMGKVRLKLVQLAMSRAFEQKSNEMLKFCLINVCGWSYEPAENQDFDEIEDMVF